MPLARWQGAVTDDAGNVQAAATITVRREVAGAPLASLFSDRNGVTPLSNPFQADGEGQVAFHALGGSYRITAVLGALTRTWRYVGIGLASETDGRGPGLGMLWSASTTDADPGEGYIKFNNATLASVTKLFLDNASVAGADIGTYVDSWDDGGSSLNRGNVVVQSADGSAFLLARVTGTVANDSGYRDVTIAHITSVGTFLQDMPVFVEFVINGANGAGDVNGPAGGVVDNEIPLYSGTGGKTIKSSSGATLATVGAGKHTIVIPAASMIPRITNGAGPNTLDSGSNDVTVPTLDFDTTTGEFAHFQIPMPKGWNNGTMTFQPMWTAVAGTAAQTVRWTLAGVAISDDDPLNASMGTAQNSDDAYIVAGDLHVGPESSAITIGGTPATGDLVAFQLGRDVANDNLAADARLIAIKLFYTTSANTDA